MHITKESILSSSAQTFIFFLDKDKRVILSNEDKDLLVFLFPILRYPIYKSTVVTNSYTLLFLTSIEMLETYINKYKNISVYIPEDYQEIKLFAYSTLPDLDFHVSCEQYNRLVAFEEFLGKGF